MQAFALEEASNLVGNMTELTNSGKIQWVCTDALPICLVKDIVSDELKVWFFNDSALTVHTAIRTFSQR